MNLVILISTLVSFIPNLWAISISRLIFGFASATQVNANSIYLNEVMPVKAIEKFGPAINFGIVTGILIPLLFGYLFIPEIAETQAIAVT